MNKFPCISICIPVFDTEPFLMRCLQSVAAQTFTDYEIIVVSDCSKGKDERGQTCKKIIRKVEKQFRKKINFIEHSENRGIMEVRRTLVCEAKGDFIFMVDSDDFLPPEALETLVGIQQSTGAEIVHGECSRGFFKDGNFVENNQLKRTGFSWNGSISDSSILESWLVEEKFSGVLWGKLIKRDLFLRILEEIPYTECNYAEDFIITFYLTYFAKSYVGTDKIIYNYVINTGISSSRKITSIHQWKMVCSAASVFTVISTWLEEKKAETGEYPINEKCVLRLRARSAYYVKNNLLQLKETVIPELQNEAYQVLCDYWGQPLVERLNK